MSESYSVARGAMLALLAFVLAAGIFVAVTVPYHATDAFVYGLWSQKIGATGGFHFSDIGNNYLARPLFLVSQGWLWNVFGEHEWMGRLLSLAFAVTLVWAVMRLAGGSAATTLRGCLAGVALIAIPDFSSNAFAGLTDVPGAAMVALAAVVLWVNGDDGARWRPAALVALGAAAVLAKANILPAVVGLGLAHMVASPAQWRGRLLRGSLPLAAGVAIALAYDVTQARHLGQGLYTFLTGGNADDPNLDQAADFVGQVNAQARDEVVLGLQWLGPYLLLTLAVAGLYGLARIAGARHRPAMTLAVPLGVVASWLLPWLAAGRDDLTVGSLDTDRPVALLAAVALVVPLWLARDAAQAQAPARLELVRWYVWAIPTLLAWNEVAPNNTRYLSGIWPPMILLLVAVLWCAVLGTARRSVPAGAAVLLVVFACALVDLRNFDALGARPDGSLDAVRTVRALGVTGWFDRDRALRGADPQLGGLLAATQRVAGPRGRVLTNDGRSIYLFGGRATVRTPVACGELRGFTAVALLTNGATPLSQASFDRLRPDTQELVRRGAADPVRLARCPGARLVENVPGSYAVLAIAP